MHLCGSLSILWRCLSFGLEWKLTFSNTQCLKYILPLSIHVWVCLEAVCACGAYWLVGFSVGWSGEVLNVFLAYTQMPVKIVASSSLLGLFSSIRAAFSSLLLGVDARLYTLGLCLCVCVCVCVYTGAVGCVYVCVYVYVQAGAVGWGYVG